MTTGEPGTNAEVINRGDENNAVFDFVIPQGAAGGSCETRDYLSAYSTAQQAGTNGAALKFDRNYVSNGTAISHTENTTQFVINTPGVYHVSFHGTISPAQGVNFPLAISLYLRKQGTLVPGTSVYHTFQTTSDTSNVAFSQIIEVSTVPTTLDMVGSGGNFIYADISMVIHRLGNLDETM